MVDHLMDTPCTDNGEPSTTRENVSTAYPPVSFRWPHCIAHGMRNEMRFRLKWLERTGCLGAFSVRKRYRQYR